MVNSKEMLKNYLKVTTEKKILFQNFDFLSIKKIPLQVSFWGAPTHAGIIDF